jgi:hypothetical protein
MADRFEGRLAGSLKSHADSLLRPIDPWAIAERATRREPQRLLARRPSRDANLRLAWVALLGATVLAIGAFAAGNQSQPPISPSPSSPEPSTSAATATPTVPLEVLPQGRWYLDWPASGIPTPTMATDTVTITLGSVLQFDDAGMSMSQGFGGGCEQATGSYKVEGTHLTIVIEHEAGGCERDGATEVRVRLKLVAAFQVLEEPCDAGPFGAPTPAPLATAASCRTLRLFDAGRNLLLVYRAVDSLFPPESNRP